MESTNADLEKFTYLEEAEKLLSEIDDLDVDRVSLEIESEILIGIISNINYIEAKLEEIDIDGCDELLDELSDLIQQKTEAENEILGIIDILEIIEDTEDELAEINSLTSIEKDLEELSKLTQKRNLDSDKLTELSELIESIFETEKALKSNEKEIEKLDKQWHEEMPETCPLCGK